MNAYLERNVMTDEEALQKQIEKARHELDCALIDDAQHIVMISMNSSTQMMAIHFINTIPELADELIKLSSVHMREAANPDARMRMN